MHNEFKRLRNIVAYKTRESKKDYLKNYFEKIKMIHPLFGKESCSL